jgi:hypothetical protein
MLMLMYFRQSHEPESTISSFDIFCMSKMRRTQLFLQHIESEAGLHGVPTSFFLGFQNIAKHP